MVKHSEKIEIKKINVTSNKFDLKLLIYKKKTII